MSKIRMYIDIKRKENKTELEELYLTLRDYNFMAGELVVMLQKLEIGFYDFVEKRKNNYSKNINSNTKEVMNKYKKEIEKMKETIEWDTEDITFEQVFLLEYEQAMDNIVKDSMFKEETMYNETTSEWFKDYKIEKEIRHKENKTEMEKLFLDMQYYNAIACDINVGYSKKHINENIYNKERLKNRKEYILIFDKCANIDTKIRNKIRINRKVSNFEWMFIKEFNELQDNYIKDLIIFISNNRR